jgi:Pectate lyase superfamily protein
VSIVQISKIQVRRGQKNSNSGVPQLSSAEFAWAVDSQELFIGNGSVLEGAPYVGNTKILTEHDNILDLARGYQYASDDTGITLSVSRSLQSKLDEYVSVTDFGAIGDGSTDCVLAFETAFSQLFRNVNLNYRKVLVIPNGEYLFTSDLTIPSNAVIQGETQNGAVLNIGSNNIRLITSTGLELTDFASGNRPQNIKVSNLTVQRTTGQLTLSGIANSSFENINVLGEYILGGTVTSLASEPAAVFWENGLIGTRVTDLQFKNCLFQGNSIAIKCLQSSVYDTAIKFDQCKFFVSDTAIYIQGVETQGNKWTISQCDFEEVANQAFRSTFGQGTIIQQSKFKNVGNNTATAATPDDVMVYFGEKIGNVLVSCTSDRQQLANMTAANDVASYTEVYNAVGVDFIDKNYSLIYLSDSFRPLAVFSALNKFTVINYCLRLGVHTRFGSLHMAVSDDLSASDNQITVTDSYTYSPQLITSPGGSLMTNFEFTASLSSNRIGDDSTLGPNLDTIVLAYKNPLATGQTGNISFDVAYGV